MTKFEVAQAEFVEYSKFVSNHFLVVEELFAIFDRQFQDVSDALFAIGYFQRVGIVARALAGWAHDFDVRHE